MKLFSVKTLEDWDRVAQGLIVELSPGMILGLSGPLGAGKTTFVQSLARALGAIMTPKSPTFSLMRTYPLPSNPSGCTRLIHVDAYRLEKPEDTHALNLDEEMGETGTLIVIEWPENMKEWISRHGSVYRNIKIEVESDHQQRQVFSDV